MSWVPLAGGNQEKILNERKVRGPSHAALTTLFLVAVTKPEATPSLDTIQLGTTPREPCAREGSGGDSV